MWHVRLLWRVIFGKELKVIKHYVVNNQANKSGRQFLFLNCMFLCFEIIKYSNSNSKCAALSSEHF